MKIPFYNTNIEDFQIDNPLFNIENIRSKYFSKKCINQLSFQYPSSQLFLMHSATAALESIAMILEIKNGDEIILPSFTFISTANAFALRGAKLVFVDIDPVGFNLDLNEVEESITNKTKAIIAVHYAGHSCDMNKLKALCAKYQLALIEDAAMAFGNTFDGKALGTLGDFGVISFDYTKQISAIQGGLLLVNNPKYKEKTDVVYNLGTNKLQFIDGEIPYYEWIDIGSKFQMGELNAAYLLQELNQKNYVLSKRQKNSELYYSLLTTFEKEKKIKMLPEENLKENFNTFFIILKNKTERDKLSEHLHNHGIETLFHYIPLHQSQMGITFGKKELPITHKISECLLRLPLYTELSEKDLIFIVKTISNFWNKEPID